MYISNENQEHLERLFNSLDNEGPHDFMELLLMECSKKTGNDEYMIYAQDEKELSGTGNQSESYHHPGNA